MQEILTSLLVCALLLGCGGSAELACPAPALPDPNPSYVGTLRGLTLVPARAHLRGASEAESASFADFAAHLQEACAAQPPTSECEMGRLRAGLVGLPAPDHPALFRDIEESLAASRASAQGDYAPADRDCDGQAEDVCDARAITGAFVRASCELRGDGE